MQINDREEMKKSSLKLPIRGSNRRSIISLLCRLLLIPLNLLHSPLLLLLPLTAIYSSSGSNAVVYATANNNNNNNNNLSAANPLIYTRLRHDKDYLQIYRNFQLEHPHEEKEFELRVNETTDKGELKQRQVVYTYYENKQVDANLLTKDDLILEALDRAYKTRLIPAYLYNYDNPKDRLKASDPKLISESRCRRELSYLKTKLSNKHSIPLNPELAAFFDSYASEEPGLLMGNYHWIGNWRQCYKRRVFDISNQLQGKGGDVIDFKGRYCIASIKSKNWNKKIRIKTDELLKSGTYFKYPEQQYDYARFFRIQLGICLPESCDSRSIDTQGDIIRELTLHRLKEEPLKSYELADLFCLPDETSELRQFSFSAWLLIFLAVVWCSAITSATIYDLHLQRVATAQKSQATQSGSKTPIQKSNLDKLVSALSLWRNYHRLTETKSMSNVTTTSAAKQVGEGNKLSPNDLLFLNAFKVISMPCILFGHIGMLFIMLNRYPLDYEALGTEKLNSFNISSIFFVDWYFVITGFLASYLTFVTKKIERSSLAQWLYTMFHRYWRLAPMYILLFWFQRTIFKHTASGPVWDYGTQNMTLRSVCQRESWLWPITLTPNLHPIHDECIMPAWYLANDMQFYMLTPFILIGLHKHPIWSWLATIGVINASVLARIVRYLTDPRVQPLELMRPRYDAYMRNNWDVHPTYIEPQYRIPSYLIGLLAGHYAYMVLSGQWRSPIYKYTTNNKPQATKSTGDRIRSILRTLLFLTGCNLLVTMMFASGIISEYFPKSWEPQVKYYTAMVYGTSHSTASIGLSLILVTLLFGQFTWLRKFLSHPIFTLISRVNFFIFLAQVEIIYWLAQSSERIIDLTPREAFKSWITLSAICYPMAVLVTLWLELPLANLEREFIGSLMAAASKGNSNSNSKQQQQPKATTGGGDENLPIKNQGRKNTNNKRKNNPHDTTTSTNDDDDCELSTLTKSNSSLSDRNNRNHNGKGEGDLRRGKNGGRDSCEEVRID